jgi:hypothetical protein
MRIALWRREDEEIGRGRKDGEGRNTPDVYQDK